MGFVQSLLKDTRDPARLLLGLPNELLLLVAANLGQKDAYALLRTNRRLACIGYSRLGDFAIQDKGPLPALHWAVSKGHIALADRLLRLGCDVNSLDGMSPDTGTDTDTDTDTAAACSAPSELFPDPGGPTVALHYAINSCRGDMVALLLEHGARIDIPDNAGHTPVHIAVLQAAQSRMYLWSDVAPFPELGTRLGKLACQKELILRLLLSHGATPTLRTAPRAAAPRGSDYGKTLLHLAARFTADQTSTMEVLLRHGIPVNARTSGCGLTALHQVALVGSAAGAAVLLEYGADVAARNSAGETPLHTACAGGNVEVVRLLLRYGADCGARDGGGERPVEWLARCREGERGLIKEVLDTRGEVGVV